MLSSAPDNRKTKKPLAQPISRLLYFNIGAGLPADGGSGSKGSHSIVLRSGGRY